MCFLKMVQKISQTAIEISQNRHLLKSILRIRVLADRDNTNWYQEITSSKILCDELPVNFATSLKLLERKQLDNKVNQH